MKRNIQKTRRLLRHLARRIVRGSAVTALVACGFVGVASDLESDAADADDADGGGSDEAAEGARLRRAVDRATEAVLAQPHSPESERALIALMAAHEALAVAAVATPTEADIQDLLVFASVASDPRA